MQVFLFLLILSLVRKYTKKKKQQEVAFDHKIGKNADVDISTAINSNNSKVVEIVAEVKNKKKRELVQFPSYPANIDRKYEMNAIVRVVNSMYNSKLDLFDSDSFEESGNDMLPISIFQSKENLNIYFSELVNIYNEIKSSIHANPESVIDSIENPLKLRKLILQFYIWSGDYVGAFDFAKMNGLLTAELVLLTIQITNMSAFGPQIDSSSPFLQSSLQGTLYVSTPFII